MRIASLLIAFAIPFAPAQAQNQDFIKPGDILILIFPATKWSTTAKRAVVVAADGKITLPQVSGTRPDYEAVPITGLTLNDAAKRLQEDYNFRVGPKFSQIMEAKPVEIMIERGTVDQTPALQKPVAQTPDSLGLSTRGHFHCGSKLILRRPSPSSFRMSMRSAGKCECGHPGPPQRITGGALRCAQCGSQAWPNGKPAAAKGGPSRYDLQRQELFKY
jgi:hypothetical protein